jgi:hypothetical protein
LSLPNWPHTAALQKRAVLTSLCCFGGIEQRQVRYTAASLCQDLTGNTAIAPPVTTNTTRATWQLSLARAFHCSGCCDVSISNGCCDVSISNSTTLSNMRCCATPGMYHEPLSTSTQHAPQHAPVVYCSASAAWQCHFQHAESAGCKLINAESPPRHVLLKSLLHCSMKGACCAAPAPPWLAITWL